MSTPMDHNHTPHPADPPPPAEFAAIEQRLNDLGASEREAGPRALEARIFAASRQSLHEGSTRAAPAPIARIDGHWFGSMLPLAAAVGLCLTAALIGFALLKGGTAPSGTPSPLVVAPDATDNGLDVLESELDNFFAALSSPGDSVLSIRTGVNASDVELDDLWRSDLAELVGMLEGSL